MYGWVYAPGGRRVTSPDRFRPIGYRAGGPTPNPQPGLGPPAPVTPAPTPKPSPGPSPAAPSLPNQNPFGGSPSGLAAVLTKAADDTVAGLQVALGAIIMLTGLLLLMAETGTGGELAASAGRGVKRAGKLAVDAAVAVAAAPK
jgi:hypothetical protein